MMTTVNIPPLPEAATVQNHIFRDLLIHPGLLFERFFSCWKITEDGLTILDKPLEPHLEQFCRLYELQGAKKIFRQLLQGINARLDRLVEMRGGLQIRAKTTALLALGLGSDHPTQNGFCFDRTSGAVYLPGSGIKGLCRAWSRTCGRETRFKELFGYLEDRECAMGRVIVLPAYPLTWPKLKVDVICNHHRDYYKKKPLERHYCHNEYPVPLDVESPVPIHHLAVQPDCEFVFRFLPARQNNGEDKHDLEQIAILLTDALEWLGFGARTAVGYGTMRVREEDIIQQKEQEGTETMPGIVKTFVSYAHADAKQVRAFLDRGAMAGVFPWLDHNELLPMAGAGLPDILKWSVQDPNLKTVTLFLSRNSRDAGWVEREMDWARDMKKRVIPVLLDSDEETRIRLKQWLEPDDPVYLKAGDGAAPSSWISTMLREAGVDKTRDVVLYLGHREGAAAPVLLPQEWQERRPAIILGNGHYWRSTDQEIDPRTWMPQDRGEYRKFEKALGTLKNSLPEAEHIYLSGLAPLGIAGLIGKIWDRGTGARITTWNSYEKKEWTVPGDNPGTGDPDSWQHLYSGREEVVGQGANILLGHFSREDQFLDGCSWVREHGAEFEIGRAIMLRFPQSISVESAPQLALECAQSFAWAKSTYQPETIYWMAGLPLAMMPLVTHLSRAVAKIVFLDFDLALRRYIEAFTLQ